MVEFELYRRLEAPASPEEFVACESGVPLSYVQIHCEGISFEAISQNFESRVIMPFIVEIVRAFAIVVRTEEEVRQWTELLWKVGTE